MMSSSWQPDRYTGSTRRELSMSDWSMHALSSQRSGSRPCFCLKLAAQRERALYLATWSSSHAWLTKASTEPSATRTECAESESPVARVSASRLAALKSASHRAEKGRPRKLLSASAFALRESMPPMKAEMTAAARVSPDRSMRTKARVSRRRLRRVRPRARVRRTRLSEMSTSASAKPLLRPTPGSGSGSSSSVLRPGCGHSRGPSGCLRSSASGCADEEVSCLSRGRPGSALVLPAPAAASSEERRRVLLGVGSGSGDGGSGSGSGSGDGGSGSGDAASSRVALTIAAAMPNTISRAAMLTVEPRHAHHKPVRAAREFCERITRRLPLPSPSRRRAASSKAATTDLDPGPVRKMMTPQKQFTSVCAAVRLMTSSSVVPLRAVHVGSATE
mmetsp:Transcript_10194/g.30249  ORF Transcript_10194/g.30249 Transcript_10194/m.30249 type:complete len:391 (-) Transcript_10194:383-1555(-)